MPHLCRYCQPAQREQSVCCVQHGRSGLACSRVAGHAGQHVACGLGPGYHELETWGSQNRKCGEPDISNRKTRPRPE